MLEATSIVSTISSLIDSTVAEIHRVERAGDIVPALYRRLDGLQDALAGHPAHDDAERRLQLQLALDAIDMIQARGRGRIVDLATRARRALLAIV